MSEIDIYQTAIVSCVRTICECNTPFNEFSNVAYPYWEKAIFEILQQKGTEPKTLRVFHQITQKEKISQLQAGSYSFENFVSLVNEVYLKAKNNS